MNWDYFEEKMGENGLVAVAWCQRVLPASCGGQTEEAQFDFKGVFQGLKIQKIVVRTTQCNSFISGEEYLLLLNRDRVENASLYCSVIYSVSVSEIRGQF